MEIDVAPRLKLTGELEAFQTINLKLVQGASKVEKTDGNLKHKSCPTLMD
jgi:hypothetical protein